MRILDDADVRAVFDLDTAIASQRAAFLALGRGEAWQPGKILGGHGDHPDTVFCYAARLDGRTGPVCKFGSVNPRNVERGLPTIHAVVTLLDPDTGAPVALMDGTALTTLRTAAASAVAVEALASKATDRLLVLGSGVQGRAHVRALCHGGRFERVSMWSPTPANLATAVAELRAEGYEVEAVASPEAALASAAVVVCATLATDPLFPAHALRAGTTVVVVGSFEPHRHEIGPDVLAACRRVGVDHAPTARHTCGPLIAAGQVPVVELGHVLTGAATGRDSEDDIVTYLSAGLGIQDASAAWSIHDRAERRGVGRTLDWRTEHPALRPIT
ncbi:ornithine cyclodeaminase family protein [Streptomyces tuirus]|uniref:Ornithine cyclodeaminase family protein n=1 Tax=Streptomyces tuirus TaxID=68278 RepID=A0A941J1M1_9ACTN|nr:ornithine cyclodeaminase family protein [Streptomyces tuirus]